MSRVFSASPVLILLSLTLSGCQMLQTDQSLSDTAVIKTIPEMPITEPEPVEEIAQEPELGPLEEDSHLDWLATQTDQLGAIDSNYALIRYKYEDDLWQDLRKDFSFDLTRNDKRVQDQYNWYRRHQKYLDRVASRANRYLYFVLEEIRARDMPTEIALLPIVESAFDPFAYSHGRASGMWQFIPSTGKLYGLQQNWWYDGRRDIIESTRAALDFLVDLHERYDDWELALAAYNSGPGNVNKAIRRNKARGLPTDFWALNLPRETRAYVPKLFALAKIVNQPEEAGVTLLSIPKQPYFKAVDVGSQIDLAQAASLADIDLNELYLLNPGFNRWATSPEGPHRLLVPSEVSSHFEKQLTLVPPEQRISWKRYTIKSGDTVSTIAEKFNTTIRVIADVNNLRSNIIVTGDTLLIPVASESAREYALSAEQRLQRRQSINPNSRQLEKIVYQVRPGDSFWEIAQKYKVGVRELAKWNGMAPTDILRDGQKLVVWIPKQQQSAMVSDLSVNNRQIIRKVNYQVRRGDSLYLIAGKFNVSVREIQRWNTSLSKYLQPGQQLTLYVDVTSVQQ